MFSIALVMVASSMETSASESADVASLPSAMLAVIRPRCRCSTRMPTGMVMATAVATRRGVGSQHDQRRGLQPPHRQVAEAAHCSGREDAEQPRIPHALLKTSADEVPGDARKDALHTTSCSRYPGASSRSHATAVASHPSLPGDSAASGQPSELARRRRPHHQVSAW